MHLDIYLQAEGDSFRIKLGHKDLTREAAKEIHPLIEQMISADSRETVLNALKAFRKEAKNQGISDNYWSSIKYLLQSNNQEDIDVTLLHENAYSYRGHAVKPGALHSDSIEKMIAFVDGSERELATDCRIL